MKVFVKITLLWSCQWMLLPGIQAQLTFPGAETLANTTTINAQQAPAAAMDAAGNFVLVWESFGQDGSGYGIYAQRFDNTGGAAGAEFKVNTTTAQDQRFPAVAMDAAGNFVVVWQSYAHDGDGWGVYGQRFDNTGSAQGVQFLVNSATAGQQRFPRVAMDGSGNFTVVWESDFDIKAQRYDNTGTAIGGEITVNTTTAGTQSYPDIAINDGGDAVVVWQSNDQDGDGFGIYAQRFDNTGTAQGGEIAVNTATANNQLSPRVGMDAAGNFVAVWVSNLQDGSQEGIYGLRFDNTGAALGSEFAVNTTTAGAQDNPDVAVAADGAFLVSWNSYGQDGAFFGMYAQAFVNTGAASGGETAVNTTTAHFQQFAAIAVYDNYAVIAWQDGDRSTNTSLDGSNYGIVFRTAEIPCNPPQAVCTNYVIQLGMGGTSNLSAANVDGGSTAECLPLSLAVSPNTFDCGDVGMHTVTLIATDDIGLTSTCTATVTVEDNESFCNVVISGAIVWEYDGFSGVKDATVTLSGDYSGSDITQTDGAYTLAAQSGTDFIITPTKNSNLLNGVDVSDALAIQQYLVGIYPVSDPYVHIAMDVDRSDYISTFDALLIRQYLLGNPFAADYFNKSWRFVPKAYPLALPPWGFPEQIDLTGVSSNQSGQDFYGVKIGDVVAGFADPANLSGQAPPLVLALHADDALLKSGSELTTVFRAGPFPGLAAWQFALQFDPARLELAGVEPLDGFPLESSDFGLFRAAEGEIRSVWAHPQPLLLDDAQAAFRLRFRVLQGGGKLHDALRLESAILPALAYTGDRAASEIALYFDQTSDTNTPEQAENFDLLQNQPNPFVSETTIGFVLPAGGCPAQLRIYDAAGRELWRTGKYYPGGYNTERISLGDAVAAGALYCELVTPHGMQTKRMAKVAR